MAQKGESGYYFNFSKHLSERHVSIARISREAGIQQRTIRKIRAASEPVKAREIRHAIDALNKLTGSGGEFPEIQFEEEFRPEGQLELSFAPGDISALQYAALGLTNPEVWSGNDSPENFRLLTSKEVYAFLPRINQILQRFSADNNTFEEEYRKFEIDIERLFGRVDNSLEVTYEGKAQFTTPLADTNFQVDAGLERANETLSQLESQGLIVDPIVETIGMFSIAVVGIVPLSFTKRTSEGDVVYRKISAMIWEYEYLSEEEKRTVSFHVKADKLVGAIKAAVAQANTLLNSGDG